MENRHGLVVDGCLTRASGIAERETALAMAPKLPPRRHCGRTRTMILSASSKVRSLGSRRTAGVRCPRSGTSRSRTVRMSSGRHRVRHDVMSSGGWLSPP